MLLDARGRVFLLDRFAIQMLPSSGVGAFFIVINRTWSSKWNMGGTSVPGDRYCEENSLSPHLPI